MSKIRKVPVESADIFRLEQKLWGSEAYQNEVYAQIAYDDHGFILRFVVSESNPLRDKTQHFEKVCEDSCVEFFVNFDPLHSQKYINFEMNANGAINAAFRTDRYDPIRLSLGDLESLQVQTKILKNTWQVMYRINYTLIQKYYPDFVKEKMAYILGNF